MNRPTYLDRALKVLEKVGTHTLDDVLADIEHGYLLSYVVGESWAIVNLIRYPRKLVAEIVLVVGEGSDLDALFEQIMRGCRERKVEEIHAWGRPGWVKYADRYGFKPANRQLFTREIE